MMGIDRADAAHGMRDRDLQLFGERQQIVSRAAIFHALADEDHRPFGREQHVDRFRHAVRIGAAARGDVGAPFLGLGRFFGRRLHEHVERHVEHHRSRPAGDHRLPGLPHHQRHLLAARRLEHLLADGAHGRGEVGLVLPIKLLERAAVELRGRHVAGHGEERHRVEISGGERDRHVHRARSTGGERRDRLALHAVVRVGHEARDALVVHRDGLDVVLALVERVDELDVAVAAQAKGVGHALADQVVDDDLAAVQPVVGRSFQHC